MKNKNRIVVILFVLLLLLFVWVCYEKFFKEPNLNNNYECPKCEEITCLKPSNKIDKEPLVRKEKVYNTNTKKYYELKVYDFSFLDKETVLINNKEIKLDKIDDILYINDKKIGENINKIYVTNNYIFTGYVGTNGLRFSHVIDNNMKIVNLETDKTLGEFEATEIYLTEVGNLLLIGGDYCGIDCAPKEKQVNFDHINNELQIKKSN